VQGTRDALGTQEEVNGYIQAKKINASIQMRWLEDGDHNLKPRKASGFSYQQHIDNAIDQTAEFVLKLHQHK
jgi:predicted alpha/beta-hydrolase family hydrolase